MDSSAKFPLHRLRRLRQDARYRRLIQEVRPSLEQLVMPYFVREGNGIQEAIASMPGQFRFSIDTLLTELEELQHLGVHSILLFGIPDKKDDKASSAYSKDGIVQKAVREIKKRFPDLLIITDVCLCAYTNHGHCGVLTSKGEIENDSTLKILSEVSLSHAEAGSDMIAPSDMMDGRIRAIRETLDSKNFKNLPIMSYAAKYASAFYGPFRDAAHSTPGATNDSQHRAIPKDRKTYQMDPPNIKEALSEIAQDISEGADIVMVKPALAYLDVIREASRKFSLPLAAYSVSGEYSMVKLAAEKGAIDEKAVTVEMMTSFVRAGASIIITYAAKDLAKWRVF
jgi:porphobilinogen synthase